MPTITRTSRLRHALGHIDFALVAVIAAVLAASALVIAIAPIDPLAGAAAARCT